MFFKKNLIKEMIIKKNFFYLFILLYSILGIYLSLQVGITHDEFYDLIANFTGVVIIILLNSFIKWRKQP